MNIKSNFKILLTLTIFAFGIASCGDDTPNDPEYTVPDTYSFENVSYSGQTQRLAMLQEMKTYMETANTAGNSIDADKLKAMYANTANAGFTQTYDDSKQLKSKTFENQQAIFEGLFEDFESASQSVIPAINGSAGVQVSLDGLSAYFVNANGLEYTQVIEKGLMGACFYYQATSVYFGSEKMDVDNETVEPGEGTAMEHHWDEAFGYLGVPIDFPSNTDGLNFWGKYINSRDALLGTNDKIMDNFLSGRAAISNDDLTTRDEAIIEIRDAWELASVGTAVHYLNTALENYNDDAIRNHALSEAVAFVYALQFNDGKKVTNANVNEILTKIGGDSAFANMNFYTVSEADLNAAKDLIAGYYSEIESVKDDL
ncbi:MAG: DUF4856 domain-containing protein [Saprospiraceae bacterium]